jgi:hypothetical protein
MQSENEKNNNFYTAFLCLALIEDEFSPHFPICTRYLGYRKNANIQYYEYVPKCKKEE